MGILAALAAWAILIAPALNATSQAPVVKNDPETPTGIVLSGAKGACRIAAREAITIACDYTSNQRHESDASKDPREMGMVLDRFFVSFKVREENEMNVVLTFTNDGTTRFADSQTVYLALDDDAGHNFLRRSIPQVDLSRIAPGQSLTFSSRFLGGRLMPGHYAFHLWIPNADASLKFNPEHNLLLGGMGVSDPSTGLNVLTKFTIQR